MDRNVEGRVLVTGGRINRSSTRTTRPHSMKASPIEQALARDSVAVSKSMAIVLPEKGAFDMQQALGAAADSDKTVPWGNLTPDADNGIIGACLLPRGSS